MDAQQAAARIREALEAGPTGLAWIVTSAADIFPEGGNYLIASCGGNSGLYRNYAANSRYIAACSPDSLRALLAERDELAKDAGRWRMLRDGDDESVIDSIYPFSMWENTHWLKRGQALEKVVDAARAALTNKD